MSTLPVLSRNDPRKLLGVIRRPDIVRAYNLSLVRREQLQRRIERMRVSREGGAKFVEWTVPADSPCVGQSVSDLALPAGYVIVSIERDDRLVIPRGETVLQADDKIVAFVEQQLERELERRLFSS